MIMQRRQGAQLSREESIIHYLESRLAGLDPPTFEEIASAEGCGVRTVIGVLRKLKRDGLVSWDPLDRRSIRLVQAEQ